MPEDTSQDTPDDGLTKLGRALQRNLTLSGLSAAAACDKAGVARSQWPRITRGQTARPRVEMVRALARAVALDENEALELAGYDPALVAATRQQPEQQQKTAAVAG